MNTSDDHEARRQAKLKALQDSRDKLDDKVYYWWQQGFSKTTIAKMLGFKTANQLARSFHEAELRKRDEKIAELTAEIAKLKGGSE